MPAPRKPDFLIIGAQKAGTTWLWNVLDQHPETDLPEQKELFFFSDASEHQRGSDWYFEHFAHAAPTKRTGEASTDYFFDRVLIDEERVDSGLPTIPELVNRHLPDVRVLLILRDPVQRAISAYYHHMRRRHYGPTTTLREAARRYPRLRIVDRGRYAAHLELWQRMIPRDRFRCYVYEEDVVLRERETLRDVYEFLGMDPDFLPQKSAAKNERWGERQVWLNYYGGRWFGGTLRRIMASPARRIVQSIDRRRPPALPEPDVAFLRDHYLAEKPRIETLLGRSLNCWTYGSAATANATDASVLPAH